ncbi:MAG: sulfatase [Planctomycetes bacterium]|nr:sulfatase [Planctomycetota bacterium]
MLTGCERQSTPQPDPRLLRRPLTNRVDIQNVILISIDTLRADHLGCYGHEYVKTPHIDAFAAEAMLFTTHINAAPSTLSSHTALMTGTYPHTHGTPKNGHVVNEKNIMLAEVLQEAGFVTAGFVAAFPLDSVVGFAQGFIHYDDEFDDLKTRQVRDQTQRRGDKVTDVVLKWLKAYHAQSAGAGRLFLFAHYFDVHWPYDAPPPYGGMYQTGGSAPDGSMKAVHRTRRMLSKGQVERGRRAADVLRREYGAEITYCDLQVGRLLEDLKARGYYDNSLMIITSDHGETFDEHLDVYAINHGVSVFDTEIHTPLIVRFPKGRFGGRTVSRLVSNIDVMPTILHLLDLPENARLEGISFAGLIDGPLPERAPVFAEATQPFWKPYTELFHSDPIWLNRGKFQAIRSATHKYMFRLPDQRFGLFDLAKDPGEQANLLTNQAGADADLAKQMRRQLERWCQIEPDLVSPDLRTLREVDQKLKDLGYLDAEDAGD